MASGVVLADHVGVPRGPPVVALRLGVREALPRGLAGLTARDRAAVEQPGEEADRQVYRLLLVADPVVVHHASREL
ncbi:hypothetical protein STTU_0759 [Streptomyces sp. Tu6071]|nr:hypothetical protein STTU_0759 [Streptomyces sp. Tu6071]